MRILSIVTLISPMGEYGGPVRVALNQARELISRGHQVLVAGAARGYDGAPPTRLEGVPVTLYPARTALPGTGFAGLISPAMYRHLPALTRDVDVVHVHIARDLVTLPVAAWARRRGLPYVLQTHGMIDESTHPLAAPLDAILTRRVLRDARSVFYLTDRERRDLSTVAGPDLRLHELLNGVPEPTARAATAGGVEVLYLARLAPRKRPTAFVEMARIVAREFPGVRFRLVGPDEGEGAAVERLIVDPVGNHVDIHWDHACPPEQVARRMADATIYVLPSVDEPYPMSVLEAMSLGLPVVITDSCGLAGRVRAAGSGFVVDGSAGELASAVLRLLRDPFLARSMGEAGRTLTREVLSMSSVAAELEAAYRA